MLLKYLSAQTLVGTEIERNDVKANCIGKAAVWKRWINNLVISVVEVPDFSFQITKKFFKRQ